MKYRLLGPEEWHRLDSIVAEQYIPHPDTAYAAVAEDESGNLTGALFLQLTFHEEPLVLTSPKVSFERLHGVIMDAVKERKGLHIYAFSDKEIIDRMAEHVGMKLLPYRVYEKEVS